jgi:hypothetical protein
MVVKSKKKNFRKKKTLKVYRGGRGERHNAKPWSKENKEYFNKLAILAIANRNASNPKKPKTPKTPEELGYSQYSNFNPNSNPNSNPVQNENIYSFAGHMPSKVSNPLYNTNTEEPGYSKWGPRRKNVNNRTYVQYNPNFYVHYPEGVPNPNLVANEQNRYQQLQPQPQPKKTKTKTKTKKLPEKEIEYRRPELYLNPLPSDPNPPASDPNYAIISEGNKRFKIPLNTRPQNYNDIYVEPFNNSIPTDKNSKYITSTA